MASLAISGIAVAMWGGALFLSFSSASASYYLFFSWPLVALMAYAGGLALISEVAGDD